MIRILLIDDASLFLEMEKTYLRQTDGLFATALTGREALGLLAEEPFDLVFVDRSLPDMDGVDCCRALKSAAGRSLPVVLIGRPEDREAALAAGADDFLAKPISKADFLGVAKRLTGLRVREHARVPVNLRVLFHHRGESFTAYSKDISKGGLFLKTSLPVEKGEIVELEFSVPTGDGALPFRAIGEVIQAIDPAESSGRPPGLGIRFVDLDIANRTRLNAFLDRMGY